MDLNKLLLPYISFISGEAHGRNFNMQEIILYDWTHCGLVWRQGHLQI